MGSHNLKKEHPMPRKTGQETVVGVFHTAAEAQAAVNRLKALGLTDDQIGVISQDKEGTFQEQSEETMAEEGASIGAVTGLGAGALWGIGIAAGVLPAIGPVIAGGTLAAIAASAGTAAAAGGILGAFIGLGIPEEEAEFYHSEFEHGRTIVTVKCNKDQLAQVHQILDDHNVYDYQRRESQFAQDASVGKRPNFDGKMVARREVADIDKHLKETGEVRVRKEVRTENKHFDVPVKREEAVIERTRLSGESARGIDDDACEEERIVLREEEVDVNKRTVDKEAVKVGKRTVRDVDSVDVELREEEIKVEETPKRRKK